MTKMIGNVSGEVKPAPLETAKADALITELDALAKQRTKLAKRLLTDYVRRVKLCRNADQQLMIPYHFNAAVQQFYTFNETGKIKRELEHLYGRDISEMKQADQLVSDIFIRREFPDDDIVSAFLLSRSARSEAMFVLNFKTDTYAVRFKLKNPALFEQ